MQLQTIQPLSFTPRPIHDLLLEIIHNQPTIISNPYTTELIKKVLFGLE